MTEKEFIEKNAPVWRELESETKFFAKRKSRLRNLVSKEPLSRSRIDRYTVLYTETANHLAYCRTFFGDTDTARYLNRLTGAAHGIIYSKKTVSFSDGFRYLATGFPRLFRRESVIFLVAFLCMFLPAVTAYFYTLADVRNAEVFMDASILENMRQVGDYDDYSLGTNTLMGTYIGENNIIVCLECLAGGFTLGIFTVYALAVNGMMVGAMAAYCRVKGTSLFFWSLILPHGITELFAIMLSGMAGLMLARGFLMPGKMKRLTSMIAEGKKACGIAAECIVLLIFSAIVEGNFTPLELDYIWKYLFAAFVFSLLLIYLMFSGRNSRAKDSVLQK